MSAFGNPPTMLARTHADLHNIRLGIGKLRSVSDRLVGVGPVGIGLDGILSFVPVVGVVYSAVAAGLLMLEAVRARASSQTLIHMGALLFVDTLLDVPGATPFGILSGVADTFFTGHKWSANLLLKHMDDTLYVEGGRDAPGNAALMADIRSGKEKRRVVFLG